MSRKGPELHSTGGFWLLVGALLLAASVRFLLWVAVAVAVHEAGHILAIRALGGRIESLRLTGVGAVLRTRRAGLCSYREECLVALAGPLASLLLALGAGTWARVFGGADAYLLTGISLAQGVFNLLPAGPLDGGRVLRRVLLAGGSAPERGPLDLGYAGAWDRASGSRGLGAAERRELPAAGLRPVAAVAGSAGVIDPIGKLW